MATSERRALRMFYKQERRLGFDRVEALMRAQTRISRFPRYFQAQRMQEAA